MTFEEKIKCAEAFGFKHKKIEIKKDFGKGEEVYSIQHRFWHPDYHDTEPSESNYIGFIVYEGNNKEMENFRLVDLLDDVVDEVRESMYNCSG